MRNNNRVSIAAAVFAALILLASCQSTPIGNTLPKLSEIVTVENAERALVIAQNVRVGYRDTLARDVKADGVVTDEERLKLRRFEFYDAKFRTSWARADAAVAAWKTIGGDRPLTFSAEWSRILDLMLGFTNVSQPIEGVG